MGHITFIMPVLNTRESWIKRAVDSVTHQTNSNWELIIVDDGSNKETADSMNIKNCKLVIEKIKQITHSRICTRKWIGKIIM